MKRLIVIFLFYFTIINVSECQTENNYLNHLAFVDGDRFTCVGILVSPRHALFNGNCVSRRHYVNRGILGVFAGDGYEVNKEKTANNYRNVIGTLFEPDCDNKKRSSRIQNCIALLTLESDFETKSNDRKITKLPDGPISIDTTGSIVGWYNKCSTRSDLRIITANITVVNRSMCTDLQDDEFCSKDTMTERIHSSSPVISGDTIIGYSTVGCGPANDINPVTDLYSHLDFFRTTGVPM